MKTPIAPGALTKGITRLARTARPPGKRSARRGGAPGRSFVLAKPSPALAADEVLIAVADASSVALQRVKIPGPPSGTTPGASKVSEIARRIAEIELIASELARAAPGPTPPAPLADAEDRLLRVAELAPGPLVAAEAQGLHRTTAEYARLLHDSYTVERTARLLAVNTSRIRQRLTGRPRTLYGIKVGKSWRVPTFQFQGRRLIPAIERVVARLAADLHPVAVYRWFTSPTPDLTFENDTSLSPLDWLRSGHPPETAAELAAEL
jgi:hypothetical protein